MKTESQKEQGGIVYRLIKLVGMEGNCEYCGEDFKAACDTGAEVWEQDSQRGYFVAVTENQRRMYHNYLHAPDSGWSKY